MSKDKLKKVSKAHIRYKTSDGKVVPGATTITGLLNKPYLVRWANQLGLEGIDSATYTDEAAKTGTLAHAMIQAYLQGMEIDRDQFSKIQIDLAENSMLSFLEWKKQHVLEDLYCEMPMVSETMKYGGTIDCYCKMDGKPVLLDFKTGKAIYEEYFVQLAAYAMLLREAGLPVEECRILRIGRDATEGFEERAVTDIRPWFQIFKNLLEIYYIKKDLGWK
ncbi:MAG: PD-(D/E)XK nuclease family protein [Bacteroidales bacterium]|nr:PD-(D/E)XK nuclease family protein [Bacteroidales bacterium]